MADYHRRVRPFLGTRCRRIPRLNPNLRKLKIMKFTVPPTREMGSHTGTASASNGETLAASALWDYNSARAHDGLPPLSRMPAGTRYIRPAAPYYIQRKDGRQIETVDQFDTRKEALAMVKEYRIADPSASFSLSRRPCKGWKD